MKFKDAKRAAVQMMSSEDFLERIKDEDPTMLKHITTLRAINTHGFITIESQAGRFSKGAKSFRTGKPYEISERAYLSGFMEEGAAAEFIRNMGLKTDKCAAMIPHCKGLDIPSALDIPLTITKSAGETVVNTHVSMALPTDVYSMYLKQAHINKTEKVVFVFCWDTHWNRNASGPHGLFKDVLAQMS